MEAPKYNSLASDGALSSTPQSQNEVRNSEGQLLCRWVNQATGQHCNECFDCGADLFHHITELHIGRKSLGNLSLYCAWNNCGHVTEKRDHIVSHARVHVPSFKPHACPDCEKAFSRSQDLKKHLKTHGKSPLLSSAASPQTQNNSPPAKQNNNLRLQIPTGYSQKIAIAPYSAPISPGHIKHQQQLMYQHQMALQNQNIYGLISGHPFGSSVPALSGPNTSSSDASLKRSRDAPVNFLPIAPLPSHNAVPAVNQAMNVHQSSKAGKEEMDMLISDFIGSIKRKKVTPEYNEEMAATLDAIAEFVIPSISIPNNFSNVDAPITPVFDPDTDMSSFLADASKTRDALASNVNSPTELNEVNSFLTQLYENLQVTPAVNEADRSGQESEGMEDTSFLDEFLRSSSVEFESSVVNQVEIVKESQLTAKASTQSFRFDPEEFETTYPHSAVEDRIKSLEFASLSESELDRFFEESENNNGKNIANKDLRMDLLKKGMEKLAIQNQEEIKNKNKHFADNSEIEVKRNTRGRYPSNVLVSSPPQDTVEKKPADYVLSDPSSIVRQLKKGHFKSDSVSKQKNIASEQNSGNSSVQASAFRKPTLGSPLDRTKSGKYHTASPSSSLSPTRRLSRSSLLASKRKPLTRSQSQPILPSADILAQKRMREYHGYVISMIMKQLERIWQDAKKAEA